jgi:hypothetical protein
MLRWLKAIVDWIFGRHVSLTQLSLQAPNAALRVSADRSCLTPQGLPTDRSRRRGMQQLRDARFRLDGKVVAGFQPPPRAARTIRSAAPRSATLAKDLAAYEQAKSALHFGPERPLPVALVKERLDARMVEVRARGN